MSRSETLRRHAPTLGLLAVAGAGLQLLAPAVEEGDRTAAPLGALLYAVAEALPDIGERPGALVLAALLAPFAVAGAFFATWRMTRNRAVSSAVALVGVAQPAVAGLGGGGASVALALLGCATWALAFQVAPESATPRYPNRPLTRFRPRAVAALVVAALLAPAGFVLAVVLVLADLVWHRDEHRDARAWLSYLPLSLVVLVGWWLGGGFGDGGSGRPGDLWRSLVFPARSGADGVWLLVFWGALVLAGFALLAEAGLGIGRRRTLVRFGALGFGWTAPGIAQLWLLGSRGGEEVLPALGFGLIVFGAVAGWRFVTFVLPPRPEESSAHPRPELPAWSELRPHFGLAPIPDVAVAATTEAPSVVSSEPVVTAPPRPPLESLLARIESPVLGVEEGLSPARFREEVRPLLPEGGRLLELTPHGRFSPYSGTLAALGAETRLVVPTRDGGQPASEEFRDIAGVIVQGVPDDGTWTLGECQVDFVLFAFGLGTIDAAAAGRILERLVGATLPGGRIVGRLAPELRGMIDLEATALEDFARARGLEVITDDPHDGFLHWRRATS